VKWNVAPAFALRVAHIRPPWASMIEREIDSPIPMPSGLVVKKALNSRSKYFGSMPPPASSISIST
jgi:hypothetical protein